MNGFHENIENVTLNNDTFRTVIYTAQHSQLVVMSLLPKEEIGLETHPGNDQFFRFELGEGTCIIDGKEHTVTAGLGIVVPAGAQHNIINTSGTEKLKFYTIYSPAHHKDGTIHRTKADATASNEKFNSITTE